MVTWNAQQFVVRRSWTGFGECEVKVAPYEKLPLGPPAKVAQWLAYSLSVLRVGSLRFTVDPGWIREGAVDPSATSLVKRFLKVNGESLAREWQAHQSARVPETPLPVPPVHVPYFMTPDVVKRVVPEPTAQPRTAASKDTPRNGLPSWFTCYCTPQHGTRSNRGVEASPHPTVPVIRKAEVTVPAASENETEDDHPVEMTG